jgi:O-methyltransferase/methyltransferase family protein
MMLSDAPEPRAAAGAKPRPVDTVHESGMYDGGIQRVLDLLDGYQNTCVIVAASRLGLFEKLSGDSRRLDELSSDTGAQCDGLRRLFRALAALGLVELGDDEVRLTEDGRFLLRDNGAGDIAVLIAEQYLAAWASLDESVRTGQPAFERVFGMSVWQHRRANRVANDAFNRFAARPQEHALNTLLKTYDWRRFSRIADIGGGNGYLLSGILGKHENLNGILFDQPHVVEGARGALAERGLARRCEIVGGSFFDGVPAGADLYVLQYVLHDWDDDRCIQLLCNCRRAMPDDARLLVLEKALPPATRPARYIVMRDLHMLTVLGGRERTLAEYGALLAEAGFHLERYESQPPACADIIEARPGMPFSAE